MGELTGTPQDERENRERILRAESVTLADLVQELRRLIEE